MGTVLGHLEHKTFPGPGHPALSRFRFHQDDIRADAFDAIPGNYVIVPTAGHTEETAGAGDYDGADIAFRNIDLDISNEAQPLTGTNADDLLALEVGKFNGHGAFLLIFQIMKY